LLACFLESEPQTPNRHSPATTTGVGNIHTSTAPPPPAAQGWQHTPPLASWCTCQLHCHAAGPWGIAAASVTVTCNCGATSASNTLHQLEVLNSSTTVSQPHVGWCCRPASSLSKAPPFCS
jgi:hypothetical protein